MQREGRNFAAAVVHQIVNDRDDAVPHFLEVAPNNVVVKNEQSSQLYLLARYGTISRNIVAKVRAIDIDQINRSIWDLIEFSGAAPCWITTRSRYFCIRSR